MMTEETKPGLQNVIQRIKAGTSLLVAGKGNRDNRADDVEPLIEAAESSSASKEAVGARPVIDDLDDPLTASLDDAPETAASSKEKKKMGMGKKIALLAVIGAVAMMAKNGMLSPAPDVVNGKSDAQQEEKQLEIPIQPSASPLDAGLTAGMANPLADAPAPDPAIGQTLDQLNLDGPLQEQLAANSKADGSVASAAAADSFGFPAAPNSDAVGRGSNPLAPSGADRMDIPFGGNSPAATPANSSSQDNPFGQAQVPAADPRPSQSPHEKGNTVLGSSSLQNGDIGAAPAAPKSDEARQVEMQLKAHETQIKELKGEVAALKAKQLQVSKPVTNSHQAHKPVANRAAKPTQAQAPRSAKRPNICVKAVAPPARNCLSCVAHAFVVVNGEETMVGQGDPLASYRVSITGDRLELQDKTGQVVHKFWSQPNGCTSI